MGGSNSGQIIESVRSYDPKSWSCLHIAEGALTCKNVIVQNNDIGPCGSDAFQEWADGISLACRDSIVRNNMIQGATDGGIVIFGSPGSQIYNNTIWIVNVSINSSMNRASFSVSSQQTLLGGINMVDYDPFEGDYTGVVVQNNIIKGGFSTDQPEPGSDPIDAIIKYVWTFLVTWFSYWERLFLRIGIAIGPRVWFGDRYGNNVSRSGTVIGNSFSGAFSHAIAVTSAQNFTVQDNFLFEHTSFVGVRGPNCSTSDTLPSPAPWVIDTNTTSSSSIQADFVDIPDGDSLICVQPPSGGDFWPSKLFSRATILRVQPRQIPGGGVAGFIIGILLFLIGLFAAVCIIRRKLRKRQEFRGV